MTIRETRFPLTYESEDELRQSREKHLVAATKAETAIIRTEAKLQEILRIVESGDHSTASMANILRLIKEAREEFDSVR